MPSLFLSAFGFFTLHGFAQKSEPGNFTPISTREITEFSELLKHYLQYPKYIQILEANEKAMLEDFKNNDVAALKALPTEAFRNLYQRFFVQYYGFKETKEKLERQIQTLKDRKIALPLGETKSIVELDLKIKASSDQVDQARFVLFSTSFDANKALIEVLNSPSVKALAQKEAAAQSATVPAAVPNELKLKTKLPGTPQESKDDRAKMAEADKLNLTPVDPEFYNTQLGKKLEKDLGGKATSWSYDFDQDELYVSVGNNIGKLRVKQRDQGTRIIQTRVGSGFQDFPADYQGDETVNLNLAKGRFLTGNPADPTLFGPYPSVKTEDGIPEGLPHKNRKGDKHDHNH